MGQGLAEISHKRVGDSYKLSLQDLFSPKLQRRLTYLMLGLTALSFAPRKLFSGSSEPDYQPDGIHHILDSPPASFEEGLRELGINVETTSQVRTTSERARQSSFRKEPTNADVVGRFERQAWYRNMTPQWKQAIEKVFSYMQPGTLQLSYNIVESREFRSLERAEQEYVLNVLFNSNDKGRRALQELLKRRSPNGSLILRTQDSRGNTLLENIHDIAVSDRYATGHISKIDVKRSIVANALTELVSPGEINQGSKGTCAATSPLWEFSKEDPAELSRLIKGLVIDGEVSMRKRGAVIKLDPGSDLPDTNQERSISERIIQVAFMEYANGSSVDYRNGSDRNYSEASGRAVNDGGLTAQEKERLLEAFYDKAFFVVYAHDGLTYVLDEIRDQTPRPVQVGIRWSDCYSCGQGGSDIHGYHAIVVTRISDSRVYFRNPHGPDHSLRRGQTIRDEGPTRKSENPRTGEESMTLKEFLSRVNSACIRSW